MSEIGFKYFKVTESIDNVCDIANEMLFTKDISKILKDTYPDTCIEEVDMGLLKGLLNGLTLEKSKIVISGKNFVQNESLFGHAADFKQPKTEKWFKTKYFTIQKNIKKLNALIKGFQASNLYTPQPNPLIPEKFDIQSRQAL